MASAASAREYTKYGNTWRAFCATVCMHLFVPFHLEKPSHGSLRLGRGIPPNSPPPQSKHCWILLPNAPHGSYEEEVGKVLEEARLMATDDYKQVAIPFFDNKWTSLVPLKVTYFQR